MGADQQKPKHAQSVIAPFWQYLAGGAYTPNGASTNVPVPSRATTFFISANGGAGYWAVNQGFANDTSPGFVGENLTSGEVALSNMLTLHVFAAASVKLHIRFYCEV